MDSINKTQTENNREDLLGKKAIKKLKELVKQVNSCFFCTKINTHESFSTRLIGAAMGKTLDYSIEGKIKL